MFGSYAQSLWIIIFYFIFWANLTQACHSKARKGGRGQEPPDDDDDNDKRYSFAGARTLSLNNWKKDKGLRTLKLDYCMEKAVKGNSRLRRRLMRKSDLMDIMRMGERQHYTTLLLKVSRTSECKKFDDICDKFEDCIYRTNRGKRYKGRR